MIAWIAGLAVAQFLRFDFRATGHRWADFTYLGLAAVGVFAALFQVVVGHVAGLYRNRWNYGSFDELSHLAAVVMTPAVSVSLLNQLLPLETPLVPSSVPVVGAVLAFCLMGGIRYAWRLLYEQALRPSTADSRPAIIFGAGEGGYQVITSMLRSPTSPYVPVAILDDDPANARLTIRGVPVVGDRHAMADVAREHDADLLVIAIPSASVELLREISMLAVDAKLHVQVLPPIEERFGAPIGIDDIRPLSERDLLGRHEIDTDIEAIAGYLTNRRVLVTGAGGSIGSELCRQISRFAPATLLMLDRDESALHGVQLSIEGKALLDTPNLIVADIRDRQRMHEVFATTRPDVVFHAAALKHLPLLEMHPSEALKTNILGTQCLLDAASASGVDRFVNISTDKAADPTSVLGYSKRIAELLTAAAAARSDGTYLSVRFGNVLGSRGSVLTTFRSQIDAGGPVTVTDPDVTRYFMTIEEAVQLVIQAGAVGRDGEALVLDMGEPVRIDDVARRLVTESTRPVEIVYTGLRPGEKLHEVLLGSDELDERPSHPLISHVRVPLMDIDEVLAATTPGRAGTDVETPDGEEAAYRSSQDAALVEALRVLASGEPSPRTVGTTADER
ncbi:MAG: polysaccharide biosynthesis protein [Acidimicrobiia bacterium]|nr:polysaccharide biosynthesis protein [Acidimicrobiia bacterium]